MKIKKFVFIIPNTSWFEKRYWECFPYTLGLLIAILRKQGYIVEIIDANLKNLSEEDLRKRIEISKPSLVGISALTLEYRQCVHRSFQIVKEINKNIITILGGIYPTLSIEIAGRDRNIDFFIRGEGEYRLIHLLKEIENNKEFDKVDGLSYWKNDPFELIINPFVERVENLDELPFPDYSSFDMNRYMNFGQKYTQNFQFRRFPVGQTITTRGCPYQCTFCSSNRIYGRKITMRSAENVLKEIEILVKKYGMKELIIVDDNFLLNRERALKIMQGIIERKYDLVWKSNNLPIFLMDDEIIEKMKESGCYQVSVSIESGCPNTLKRMKKPINLDKIKPVIEKIKKEGVELISNFVIGFPGDTWEDIRECFQYAESIDIDYVLFSIATPLPATELYDTCIKGNVLPQDFSFENFKYYGFGKGVITTKDFVPFELEVLRAFEWDRINFKTEERRTKIARMLGITLEELEEWRKETRRKIGVNINIADQRQVK